jgi:spore maturation protein CgeB
MNLVVIGLTLSSSWGNGHATTWRALLRAFAAEGERGGGRVTFLERDVPWYAAQRDMPAPDFARLELYADLADLRARLARPVREADAVLIGSYVPEGVAVIDWALETARGPVAFYDIDTPVTLAKLAGGDEEYLARRQIPLFDTYFSFTGGPTLDRLEREHGARRAAALYCTVDAARYRHEPGAPRRWRLGYLGTYSDDRQPALERLLLEPARRRPADRFVVAGPQYPEGVFWPANVLRVEHCPPAEHQRFYNSQDFTLNVTRAAMVQAGWSPSVRLFEAAACAVPIISDRWAGLDVLFPDGAVVIADTGEDVLAALDLSAPRRRAIGRAAQEIVFAEHRAEVRARQLTEQLQARRIAPRTERVA